MSSNVIRTDSTVCVCVQYTHTYIHNYINIYIYKNYTQIERYILLHVIFCKGNVKKYIPKL